jgi:hypothetical protein
LHGDQVIGIKEEDWFVAGEVDSASRETAARYDDAKTCSAMMDYAVKITHNMGPNTRHVRFALHDSLQSVARNLNVHAAIA